MQTRFSGIFNVWMGTTAASESAAMKAVQKGAGRKKPAIPKALNGHWMEFEIADERDASVQRTLNRKGHVYIYKGSLASLTSKPPTRPADLV